MYSLERIFALDVGLRSCTSEFVIHIESDVYLTLSSGEVEEIKKRVLKTAVTRHGPCGGSAAIMFSPSAECARESLNLMSRLLITEIGKTDRFLTDMELLGLALNAEMLQELPSTTEDSWLIGRNGRESHIIFDGAAYGQYLLGTDPVHNKGFRVSGYRNPILGMDLSRQRWTITSDDESPSRIGFWSNRVFFELANLHAHSKELLPDLSIKSPRWQRLVAEANCEVPRLTEGPISDVIHNDRISLIDMYRLSRHLTFGQKLKNSFQTGKLRPLRKLLCLGATRKGVGEF